jgi:hypothetical protein
LQTSSILPAHIKSTYASAYTFTHATSYNAAYALTESHCFPNKDSYWQPDNGADVHSDSISNNSAHPKCVTCQEYLSSFVPLVRVEIGLKNVLRNPHHILIYQGPLPPYHFVVSALHKILLASILQVFS